MRLSAKMLGAACWGLLSLAQAQVTPVRHVVFILKENRSFDHIFGTMPGVNGATQGKLSSGQTIPLSRAPTERKTTPTIGTRLSEPSTTAKWMPLIPRSNAGNPDICATASTPRMTFPTILPTPRTT